MKKMLNLAIVQSDLAWENIAINHANFSRTLKTVNADVDIAILPEMFTTGFSMNAQKLAQPMNGDTVTWMKSHAASMGFAICGSIIIEEDGNYFNRFVFATPEGTMFTYDKRHLFTFANENNRYTHGRNRLVFEYKGWRILPQICYDVRFPVWSRNRNDYDLIINVANFPGERRDAWITLNKARAIENQSYVAAANRVGTSGMDIYYTGDSMILDMLGKPISEALPGQEKVIYGSLNIDLLKQFRDDFPVLPDADAFTLSE